MEKANPFSPVMPINSGIIVGKLTVDKPKEKVGAALKPCEIRAFIELVRLGQARTDNLLIIGTDCLGTCEVGEYAKLIDEMEGNGTKGEKILAEMR